jgi:hypothetical protein
MWATRTFACDKALVTHCDITHSTRVFTAPQESSEAGSKPVDIRIGGWQNGMMLKFNGRQFAHHARNLPLDDVPFTVTNWGDWIATHPESLVYTGKPCSASQSR